MVTKQHWIGTAALLAGIAALGLSIIPPIALGRPNPALRWLDPAPPQDPVQIDSGRPLIGINGEIQFRIMDNADESPDEAPADEHHDVDNEPPTDKPSLVAKTKTFLKSLSRHDEEGGLQEQLTEPDAGLSEKDAQMSAETERQDMEEPERGKKDGLLSKLPQGFKISFNNQNEGEGDGEDIQPQEVAPAISIRAPAREERLANGFAIASSATALVGLLLGIVAFRCEKPRSLAIGAISCSCVALTWQYIAAGVLIGAAIAVFVVLLAILAQAFS